METLSKQPQPEDSIKMELPHVRISWTRLQPSAKGSLILCYEDGERTFRLIFCLDGRVQAHHLVHKSEACQQICSGCCGLLAASCRCCCLACATRSAARVVEVQYVQDYLRKLLGADYLQKALKMASAPNGPLQIVTKITPSMSRVLRMMEDHIVQESPNPLFVKAKSLELLWLFMAGLDASERHSINPTDREAVRTAQGFLETNMSAAPRLAELAAHVGMSVSKLKQLFPRVCGLTPYAYLRQARMERAMHLLHHAGMNVTEVALEVGYASPSRFSRAFAEHFGFNPSQVKQSPEYCFFRTGSLSGSTAARSGMTAKCRDVVS
jgi:AraC-like DNA-binding protein